MEIAEACPCGENATNLFFCESCPSHSDECSNETQRENLCDSCITPHVRCGHDVKTLKGQVPLICDTHKMLHSLYCKTCDLTYCSKCSLSHSKHELGSIEERASQVKKEVFQILTEFEMAEKPLRSKKESMIEQIASHGSEQNQLKESFLKEVEQLKYAGVKLIETNCGIFSKKEEKIVETIDQVVQMQQKARNLLSNDDCTLIRDYKQLNDAAANNRNQSEVVLSEKLVSKSCKFSSIEREFSEFKDKMMLKMKSELSEVVQDELNQSEKSKVDVSRLEKDELEGVSMKHIEHYSSFLSGIGLRLSRMNSYQLIVLNDEIKMQDVIISEDKLQCIEEKAKACFPNSNNVKAVYFNQRMSELIVQSDTQFWEVSFSKRKIRCLKLQPMNGFICPFIYQKQMHQCYWDSNEKLIRFTHNATLQYTCSGKPKLISFQIYPFVCLLTDRDIMICSLNQRRLHSIPFGNYNVQSVDYVNFIHFPFTSTLFLVIWSVKLKSIYIMLCHIQESHWHMDRAIKWSDPLRFTAPFNLDSFKVQALPAVQKRNSHVSNSTGEGFQYVYGIFPADRK